MTAATNPLFDRWEDRGLLKVSPPMPEVEARDLVIKISHFIQHWGCLAWVVPSRTGGSRVAMKKKLWEYLQCPREQTSSGLLDRSVSYRCVYYREQDYVRTKEQLEPFQKNGLRVEFDDKAQKITHWENQAALSDLGIYESHDLDPLYSNNEFFMDDASFQSKMERLASETKEFFSSESFPPEQLVPYKEGNDQALIAKLLDGRQGFCIAEGHTHVNGRKWLIENMAVLKAHGVKTLFMEFLHYDTMQDLLDQYFTSKEEHVSGYLKYMLDHIHSRANPDPNYHYARLVECAKRHGIKVVGIDTSVSAECGMTAMGATDPERLSNANYLFQMIINKEKGDEPFVVLVGHEHIANKEGVPGLGQILHILSLHMHPEVL